MNKLIKYILISSIVSLTCFFTFIILRTLDLDNKFLEDRGFSLFAFIIIIVPIINLILSIIIALISKLKIDIKSKLILLIPLINVVILIIYLFYGLALDYPK